ncbi:MAG: hypothetical protein Q9191_003737 [Dirinaria sp. TL-2023a]
MVRTTRLNLMAMCLLSSTVPSFTSIATALNTANDFDLFSRATCSTSGYSPCNKAGLPSNFCCPSDETCIPFNNNKSIVCCPAGQECKTFNPISCDISKQNATLSPESQLHSVDLSGSLAKCGSNCCPNGYSCQNNLCVMQTSSVTSKAPSTTPKSSSATKPSTTTPTHSATSTTSTSTSPKNTATSVQQQNGTAFAAHCNQFPASAVLVGFFPGIILGALLTIATICLFGRRKANSVKSSNSSVFSSPAATVSDPIYQESNAYRSDFLRRGQPNMDGAATNAAPRRTSKVRSLFSRSPPLTPPMRKEPSMESIKIYSPPNMANVAPAEQRQTTFSEMMHNAGFRAGEPYLGSPGKVDPRSRGVGG